MKGGSATGAMGAGFFSAHQRQQNAAGKGAMKNPLPMGEGLSLQEPKAIGQGERVRVRD
jgi:hypothetical protein